MAILKGLKSIKEHDEKIERQREARERKVTWLTVGQNEKVDIIFLQELDEGSIRYSEKNGVGFLAQEHSNPSKAEFYKRILCSKDEEHDFQCWGCEKNGLEWSKSTEENKYNGGWGVKTNLYINVLVRRTDEKTGETTEEVAVMQRKRSDQSFVDFLLELAESDGFISNRLFSLQRKGTGFKTKYILTPKNDDAGVNVEDYELFDLTTVLRDVPYPEQAKALGGGVAAPHHGVPNASGESEPEDGEDWL